jgi:hypothetical protein
MKVEQKFIQRFQELVDYESWIMQTRTAGNASGVYNGVAVLAPPYDHLNAEKVSQWGTSCLHLLKQVFGIESDYYINFKELFPHLTDWSTGTQSFKKALGVFKAAKEDYEHGYLFDARTLIEAEVFSDFLEQAEHLLGRGYYAPAAVVAGSVLEDGLRKLCQRNNVSLPAKATIDPMNVELVKAGIYNTLTQKSIIALADIRNKAAHGKWNEFDDKHVEQMISQVRTFMEAHFN